MQGHHPFLCFRRQPTEAPFHASMSPRLLLRVLRRFDDETASIRELAEARLAAHRHLRTDARLEIIRSSGRRLVPRKLRTLQMLRSFSDLVIRSLCALLYVCDLLRFVVVAVAAEVRSRACAFALPPVSRLSPTRFVPSPFCEASLQLL